MIDVSHFHEKLNLLKEYMDYWVESKDFDNRIWWDIYEETGMMIYRKNYHKTFKQWLKTRTHKALQTNVTKN